MEQKSSHPRAPLPEDFFLSTLVTRSVFGHSLEEKNWCSVALYCEFCHNRILSKIYISSSNSGWCKNNSKSLPFTHSHSSIKSNYGKPSNKSASTCKMAKCIESNMTGVVQANLCLRYELLEKCCNLSRNAIYFSPSWARQRSGDLFSWSGC